jgi:hypothetical protein
LTHRQEAETKQDGQNWDVTIKAVQGLHSDKRYMRFQENKKSIINQGTLPGLLHLLISRPARGVLKHFFHELHQMLWSNLLAGLPGWVLDSTVLPSWVNLFLQRNDSVSQTVGGHIDSSQAMLFQEINLVGQGCDMGEFKRSRLFTP